MDHKENVKLNVNKPDSSKLTALHYAARNGQLGCVKILIEEAGADINVETGEGTTPLQFAARYRRRTGKPMMEVIGATPSHETTIKIAVPESITDPIDDLDTFSDDLCPTEDSDKTDLIEKPLLLGPFQPIPLFPVWPTIDDPVIHYLVQKGAKLNERDSNGWSALHYAAIRGNEVATRQLLQEPGIDTEILDHDGMQSIHLAALHNELEICRQLLLKRANPYARTQRDCLPLHFACSTGNLELVRLLLKACRRVRNNETGKALQLTNGDGESPLHWAVANGHTELVRFCVENGADPNLVPRTGETSLHMAARVGNLEMVEYLLEVGVYIDTEDLLLQTALHKAAERNNVDVVRLLVDKGSDVENQDEDAYTPFLLAAARGHVEVVRILIDSHANIFAQERSAKGVVYLCAEENQPEVLTVISEHTLAKHLFEVPNIFDDTPLHVASKLGHSDVVEVLIQNGVNISGKNERERTAFHFAAKYGRLKIAKLLLKKVHSLLSEIDEDGNSAIHLAAASGHLDLTEWLLANGAAVDARNSLRWTPLDCAAANGHRACAACLLENDSPVDPRDVSNTTPLHLACKFGHSSLVELLLNHHANPTIRMVVNEHIPDCGPNALDTAIDYGQKECTYILLRNAQWKRAMRNQTTGPDGRIQTPMRKLIMLMPDVAEFVMNRSIRSVEDVDLGVREQYNFEFLEDTFAHWSPQAVLRQEDLTIGTSPMGYLSEKFRQGVIDVVNSPSKSSAQGAAIDNLIELDVNRPYSKDTSILMENHPLNLMVKHNRSRLLEHRIVTTLLNQKWLRTGFVYHINLFIYILYLIFYSIYMMNSKAISVITHNNPIYSNMTLSQSCHRLAASGSEQPMSMLTLVSKYAVLAFALINLTKEIFQLVYSGYRYFTLENLMEFLIFVLAILSVVDSDKCLSNLGMKRNWQWQCGAVGIFLAWLNLLLFLRRIPTLGIFVLMFTVVMQTFGKFFIVLFLFIFAFAFGFHLLLFNHPPFNTLGNSLLKTAIMMIGEMDFDETFNNQFTSNDSQDILFFNSVTYALFVTFLVVMTIVLMNLLVGLAVDDIKGVQTQATVKRLAMQIELIMDIESILPFWLRKRLVQTRVILDPKQSTLCNSMASYRWMSRVRRRFRTNVPVVDDDEAAEVHQLQLHIDHMADRVKGLHKGQEVMMNMLIKIGRIVQRMQDSQPLENDASSISSIDLEPHLFRSDSRCSTPHRLSPTVHGWLRES